ncbi:tripartite tricarboxylate transporter TctB family protein [Roseovarius sp.]|uniref:tripartite tricarboxylate transporter TctB family protein n=1 Tax=Roseovarius sp. TaxID=1486281 RepID=UPI003B5ABA20
MKDGLSDTVAGAALVGFALVLWVYLIPTFVTEVEFQAEMSPRFFPRLGAILIFGSGLVLFLRSLRTVRSAVADGEAGERVARPLSAMLVALAMSGFIILFQQVGYAAAAPFLLVAMTVLFGGRHPVAVAAVAIVTTAVLYALFNYALNLPLS